MRAGDVGEGENQRHQRGAGRQRVCEKGDGDVTTREPFAHDARSDDGGDQQRGCDGFGDTSTEHVGAM